MLISKNLGLIKGVKVSTKSNLTNLLFLDDVLIFGLATMSEWIHIKDILLVYYSASSMKASERKSILMSSGGNEALIKDIVAFLAKKD